MSEIVYREDIREFRVSDVERLFLSVGWESGRYPDRIAAGLRASTLVISAWDGDRLIGLVRGLDDGETVGFLHYVLVDPAYQGRHVGGELMRRAMERYAHLMYVKIIPSDPKTLDFYRRFGFETYDNYTAMQVKRF